MSFVTDGEEALRRLEAQQFDVIVTDMRMPGMSGAELLGEVAVRYPSVARVILSGQTGEEELMNSVTSAHQYLSKPCDPDRVEAVIDRATRIHEFLTDPSLIALVSSINSLPSFPAVAASISKELQGVEPSLARVGEIVRGDIALSAKLLQLVNSSFFGLSREISDVREAVTLLGSNRTMSLSLMMNMFSQVPSDGQGVLFDGLWQRSMTVAVWAERIAQAQGLSPEERSLAYTSGLFTVAGALILGSYFPDRYLRTAPNPAQVSFEDLERDEFGASAPQVGAYTLGLWGLPAPMVESVGFHRRPSLIGTSERAGAITAVHIASAVTDALLTDSEPRLDEGHLAAVDGLAQLDSWIELCLSRGES